MARPGIKYALAGDSPSLPALAGRRLVVCLVVNVESWPFDQPMPRKIITAPHGTENTPDVPNFSWVEYGMRVGLERLLRACSDRGLPGGISMNAAVSEDYPRAFEALMASGWEFVGHGVRQQSLHAVDDERAVIEASIAMLRKHTGIAPRGWLGPGLQETFHTPELLAKAGIRYVMDWCVDDVPTVLATGSGPLVVVPYSLELNDSVVFAVEKQTAAEYERRVRDSVAVLSTELSQGPKVLALPLHPHLLGVPHRFGHFLSVLDMLMSREDTVFVQPGDIYDWYVASGGLET